MNATLNVMIHGLFFMELSTDDSDVDFLEITAPDLDDHDFMGGVRNNLAVLNDEIIDWTKVTSIHGRAPQPEVDHIPADVPSTMLQFSRTTTNTGDLVHDYKGKIKLPWPRNFFSRRLGPIPKFANSSKVGKEITDRCSAGGNTKVGVVTGLAYDFDWPFPTLPGLGPTLNFHFYYQPPKGHDINGVNVDLVKAGKIFGSPKDFDLQLDKNNEAVTPVGTGGFLTGVGTEDEISLDEKLTRLNPNQIDIPKLLDCLGEQSKLPIIPVPVEGGGNFFILLASTANCPNMFVGS